MNRDGSYYSIGLKIVIQPDIYARTCAKHKSALRAICPWRNVEFPSTSTLRIAPAQVSSPAESKQDPSFFLLLELEFKLSLVQRSRAYLPKQKQSLPSLRMKLSSYHMRQPVHLSCFMQIIKPSEIWGNAKPLQQWSAIS